MMDMRDGALVAICLCGALAFMAVMERNDQLSHELAEAKFSNAALKEVASGTRMKCHNLLKDPVTKKIMCEAR